MQGWNWILFENHILRCAFLNVYFDILKQLAALHNDCYKNTFFAFFDVFFFILFFRKYEKHFSTKNLKITEIVITENIFCQSAWHVLKLKSHDKMCAILKKYLLTLETTQEILVTDGGKPDVPFFAVFWGAVSVLFFLWFGRWFQWINSPLRFD